MIEPAISNLGSFLENCSFCGSIGYSMISIDTKNSRGFFICQNEECDRRSRLFLSLFRVPVFDFGVPSPFRIELPGGSLDDGWSFLRFVDEPRTYRDKEMEHVVQVLKNGQRKTVRMRDLLLWTK